MESDVLILGGGAAGLSLARRLAERGEAAPRTVVLESRKALEDDRTWCFWALPSSQLTHLVRHRWSKVSVAAGGDRVVADCAAFPYSLVPASAFNRESADILAASGRIGLELGVDVLGQPRKVGDTWEVDTSAGLRRARRVVDTRPPAAPAEGGATLWQSFLGQEISVDSPTFDPGVAEILHFAEGERGRVRFDYVLPLSPTRALLEVTVFATAPAGPASLREDLADLVARRLGSRAARVERTEHGILPMGLPRPTRSADPSLARAGLMAGGARPSTGYAFQRIQRWAENCARALAEGRDPVPHAEDGWLMRGMDNLFLRVIRRRPEAAPALFLDLFRRAPTPALVRFLGDEAGLSDALRVVAALPPGPFLRELVLPARAAPLP